MSLYLYNIKSVDLFKRSGPYPTKCNFVYILLKVVNAGIDRTMPKMFKNLLSPLFT